MTRYGRPFLALISLLQLLLAAGFCWQRPFLLALWPFEGTTPLTFLLIASILAAAGASTLWAVLSKNDAALAGIALDYVAILTPVAVFLLRLGAAEPRLTGYGIAAMLAALLGLALFLWSARLPVDDRLPLPGPVRWAFAGFILALIIAAARLILQTPNVIPWTITPQLSVLIGWMFLGAACYFGYALARPSWQNGAGQLVGFLAYDLVLIGPFLKRLPTVAPEFRTGLLLYLAVVSISGLLAVYYLFLHPPTRLWRRSPPAGAGA